MTGEFQEKSILITGASRGLGYVCAQEFEKKGARLVLAARSLDKLEQLKGYHFELGNDGIVFDILVAARLIQLV